jgi:hypothetical protein
LSTPATIHRELFDQYLTEMRRAKLNAEVWWKTIIDVETGRAGDRRIAERTIRSRYSVGPAAHVGVIAVLRRFWLSCAALNIRSTPLERLPPEELLLGMLLSPPNEDLARFLSDLPYWPIGLDADGNWV